MTNLHQNENRGREAIGRDSTGRPLSTADLAAAAQRPRDAERQEVKETARADEREREIGSNDETGTYEALDPHRRGASWSAGSTPETGAAADRGRTTAGVTSMGTGQDAGPADTLRGTEAHGGDPSDNLEPLFTPDRAETYRSRWLSIQSSFVDDPRQAVRSGDELVAQVMANLASTFAEERHRMEAQLDATGEGATENLRVALRRYRSFFDRLLSL